MYIEGKNKASLIFSLAKGNEAIVSINAITISFIYDMMPYYINYKR